MKYLIHIQHGSNGEPLIECDTEQELIAKLSDPDARWAEDRTTGEAILLKDGALERHVTDRSRQMFADQKTSETIQ